MQHNIHAFLAIANRCFDLEGPVYRCRTFSTGFNEAAHAESLGGLDQKIIDRRGAISSNRVDRRIPRIDALTDSAVNTIVCVDALDRMFDARRELQAMARALAPGGVMLIAAPMKACGEGDGGESWRYTPACIDQLLSPLAAKLVGTQGSAIFPHTVYAVGCKSPVKGNFFHGANALMSQFQDWLEWSRRAGGWKEQLRRGAEYCLSNRVQRERIRDRYKVQFVIHVQPGASFDGVPAETNTPSASTGSRLNHWG